MRMRGAFAIRYGDKGSTGVKESGTTITCSSGHQGPDCSRHALKGLEVDKSKLRIKSGHAFVN